MDWGAWATLWAPRLAAAGHDLIVFDTVASSVKIVTDAGAKAAASVAEVGKAADIVFLSLPTPQIVLDVALEIATGKPRIIVDLSTSGPAHVDRNRQEAEGSRRCIRRCAVSGGRAGALAGKLALMVACTKDIWTEVEPLLAVLGKVFYVGPDAGQAQTMKLVNNMLSVVALAATSEGMAMGVKAGLDANIMIDVLNASSGRNSATVDKFPRAVLPRTFEFGFATGLSLKDVRSASRKPKRSACQ